MASVYGTKPYNLCQIGEEATQGQNVLATTVWRGPFAMPTLAGDPEPMEEDVGTRVAGERTMLPTQVDVVAPMPETALTYEQFPHLLQASIAAGVQTGAIPGPFEREYELSFGDGAPAIKTYTLRLGNKLVAADQQIVPFAWVDEWKIMHKSDQATWRMSATWRGQRMYAGAFTPSMSAPDVVEALTGNTRLYIDNSGDNIGDTEVVATLLEFSLTYRSGIRWIPIGDGDRYPKAIKFGKPSVDFTIRYELEEDTGVSRVATERAAADAGTLRLIRLECPGAGGRTFTIDMAAKYRKPGGYDEQDENVNVAFDGYATYSPNDDLYMRLAISNLLYTLTPRLGLHFNLAAASMYLL
jgi:hypothetical protein